MLQALLSAGRAEWFRANATVLVSGCLISRAVYRLYIYMKGAFTGFEWDDHNVAHIARHDVTPEEVEQVFANGSEFFETRIDPRTGEERHLEIGETSKGRVLFVAWTPRKPRRRVVTAWQASRQVRAALRAKRKRRNR